MATTLRDKIKLSLRITHTRLDYEIDDTISAAKLDLKVSGIKTDNEDSLIEQAIKLYCKWQYDFNNKGDQYYKSYDLLKKSLAISGDYKEVVKDA